MVGLAIRNMSYKNLTYFFIHILTSLNSNKLSGGLMKMGDLRVVNELGLHCRLELDVWRLFDSPHELLST